MNAQVIQNLRYKLQKRIRRLNSADVEVFLPILYQFWAYYDNEPMLRSVMENTLVGYPEISKTVADFYDGTVNIGETEEESALISYKILRSLENEGLVRKALHVIRDTRISNSSNYNDLLDAFRDVFLESFYEYLDEHLDDQKAILSLLYRYKHRSEWFHREKLLQLFQKNEKIGEKLLALDLYNYLFDSGINFSIEPSSIDGAIDMISTQMSDDPLLADAKIFDGSSRGKAYICKGFNQIFSYTKKYNEPFGYLVIFNVSEKDLSFLTSNLESEIPVVTYNHKTIFFITIDIFKHDKPPSKRGLIKPVEIKEEDLFQYVETTESE